jgi:hypothetical protein
MDDDGCHFVRNHTVSDVVAVLRMLRSVSAVGNFVVKIYNYKWPKCVGI